jgi:hypothetical protein
MSIGHPGIFVSGNVARKEHDKFSSNIDLIDTLPPGLYEAFFEAKTPETAGADLAGGDWVMRCEARTLDDIRSLGGNNAADEHCFETVDRVSQANLALYRMFMQPVVRALVNPSLADAIQKLHPLRLQYELLSDANPLMAPIAGLADAVRENRRPAAGNNPFLTMQEQVSHQIVAALDRWRVFNETCAERTFMAAYGSKALQAAAGVDSHSAMPLRKAAKSLLHHKVIEQRTADLRSRIASGGLREALIRALIFAGMDRAAIDERGFEVVRRIRQNQSDAPLSAFKATVREQFDMLLIDTETALAAIPSMLPKDAATRQRAFDLICEVLSARGQHSSEDLKRIRRIGGLFDTDGHLSAHSNLAIASDVGGEPHARAS